MHSYITTISNWGPFDSPLRTCIHKQGSALFNILVKVKVLSLNPNTFDAFLLMVLLHVRIYVYIQIHT